MSEPCPGTCEPTVDHFFRERASRARCRLCGVVGESIPWEESYPSKDTAQRCLEAFRQEHHHAD